MSDIRRTFRSLSGFTLLELTIVIVILGLLATGGLVAGAGMVEQTAQSDTKDVVSQAEQSIRDFYKVNGRLPCVGSMTAVPGTATFGVEGCGAGAGRWIGNGVLFGTLPTKALGLSDAAGSDKFGSRLTYAVTLTLTDSTTFGSSNGAITMWDSGGNTITANAAFVVISHGKDRKGAWPFKTSSAWATVSCAGDAATPLDAQNCYASTAADIPIYRDAPFNNGSVTASFFDDVIKWVPYFQLKASNSESSSLWSANGDANLYSIGTDSATGNTDVGIGTNDPTAKLHVRSTGDVPYVMLDTTSAGADRRTRLNFSKNGTIGMEIGTDYAMNGTNDLYFYNRATGTNALYLNPNGNSYFNNTGNVGIGMTNPGYKLNVTGDIATTSGSLYVNTGAWGSTSILGGVLTVSGTTAGLNFVNRGGGNTWVAYSDSNVARMWSSAYGDVMSWWPNGAVGIANTLTVGGSVSVANGSLTVAGGGSGVYLNDRTQPATTWAWYSQDSLVRLWTSWGGNGDRIVVWPMGEVDFYFSGPNWGGPGRCLIANGMWCWSDRRLKEDIVPIPGALDKLAAIEGVYFKWKNEPDKAARHIGVIAQDVQKVFPEAVETGKDGNLTVNLGVLVSPLIEAVKELKNRNDVLQKANDSLSKKVDSLLSESPKAEKATQENPGLDYRLAFIALIAGLMGGLVAPLLRKVPK